MGFIKKVKAIKNFASDPGGAAGTAVGGAVAASGHPYLAVAAAKGTKKVVDKGIAFAKSPEGQEKIGNAVDSAVGAVRNRVAHFKIGNTEHLD